MELRGKWKWWQQFYTTRKFFPGEPQIALFMAGRWSRADGLKLFMCQKMRGWAKRRSHAEDASIDAAAAGGTRGRAAIRSSPVFPPVTQMEPYENVVEGLLQLAEHAPGGLVFGSDSSSLSSVPTIMHAAILMR